MIIIEDVVVVRSHACIAESVIFSTNLRKRTLQRVSGELPVPAFHPERQRERERERDSERGRPGGRQAVASE